MRLIISIIVGILLQCSVLTAYVEASQPKLVVVMQEKVMGVFGTTGFEQPNQAELTIMNYFRQHGFIVVDSATVKRNLTQAKGLRMLEGDDKAAAALGLQYGSQYSIVGTAISKPAGAKLYGTQMQSIQATLTARVVRNADARVVATANASATQAHIDEVRGGALAIEKAARQIAEDLNTQLAAASSGKGHAASASMIYISNLVSYRHLDFVMDFLDNKLQGINKVELRSYAAGTAELGVNYQGTMAELARALAKQKFKGFRLEPTYVTPGRVDIRAILDRRP